MNENRRYIIGVVGMGFVGQAVARGFTPFADVKTYDIDPKKCDTTFEHVIDADFVFVCLPTPMYDDGECDLSIIKGFFSDVLEDESKLVEYERAQTGAPISALTRTRPRAGTPTRTRDPIFIIKSTVPIGTTRSLVQEFYPLQIVHSPEFLTARTSLVDFITPARNIVGGHDEWVKRVRKLYEDRFVGIPVLEMYSEESEMIKYMANCFFAVKVIFFNEMKLLSEKLPSGANWDIVLQGLLTDGRIGLSHYEVPGHDGQRGFGGTCFPKDINAMIKTMEKCGLDPKLLKAAWEQNKEIRQEHEWNFNPSAVTHTHVKESDTDDT